MGRKPKTTKTYQTQLSDRLNSMAIEESFSKKEFIKEVWGDNNYFNERSFDVFFTHSKKEFPQKKFRTIKRFITRLS